MPRGGKGYKMTIKYLKNVNTIEELKKAFRAYTKKLHPDCGGSKDEMSQLNNEYDYLFIILKNKHNETADEQHKTTETPEEFREIIEKLIHFEGVEVELCGSWIWCRGNTFAYKDELKELGFKWSKSKKSWHWHHETLADLNRRNWGYSMEKIREMHGSTIFANEPQPLLA